MLKVGFNRPFQRRWRATFRSLLLVAALFPAIASFAQPTINSNSALANTGTYGSTYNYNITIDTWPNPVDFHLNAGAPGLTLIDHHDGTAVLTGTPTDVGTFPIVIEVVDPSDLQASTQSFDLVISKANLIAKAQNQSRFYGYDDPTFTINYTGFKFTDTANDIDTPPVAVPTSNDGSVPGNYTINVSIASALDDHYTFTPSTGTLLISPAPLSISAANKTKAYGEPNPVFTLNYSGFQNGETSAALTSQPSANVSGVDETTVVGSYPILVTGGASPNYTITRNNGNLSIAKATLTVKADDQSRFYGDANPALTMSYSGFVNGDTPASLDFAPTISTTAAATTAVGTVPITVFGGGDENYDLVYQSGTLTINKAPLTITANSFSRPYFTANPTLTITYVGLKNNETPAAFTTQPTVSTTAVQASNAGTYPITVSGGAAANYSFDTYNNGTLTITKIALTAKADDKLRLYGEANPIFSITYTGFVNGETASVIQTPPTASTSADNTSPAGTYPITVSVASAMDENYTFTPSPGTLTVGKAMLTITADSKSKAYGSPNPTFTFTYSGFVGTDNAASLTTLPSVTTVANTSSNAGSYSITPTGATDENYDFTYVAGSLTITQVNLTVTAADKSKAYGAALPTLTFNYSGFVGSETSSVIDTPPTISTTATATSNAGTYPITLTGGSDNNYTFTLVNATLTIDKVTLTVTADSQTKAYAAAMPALTFHYSGFVGSETSSVIDTPPQIATTGTQTSNAGTYPITLSNGADNNYNFSFVNATLTITKLTLTITADDKSKAYGSANPAFTFSYSGFAGSETPVVLTTLPSATTTATVSSNAGSYAIQPAGAVDENYTFNYVNGILTVTKIALTVTADDKSKVYGAALPVFTLSYSGFISGENSSVIEDPPTVSTTATASSPIGNYPILLTNGSDVNYTFTLVDGTLNITKAMLTATADDKSRSYGAANPPFTITYTGFVNGDNLSSITQGSATAPSITPTSNVGSYANAIVPSGGSAANYSFNYVPGTLTITKATLTVNADSKTKVYGAANPLLTFTYSGFLNGETASVLEAQPTISTTAILTSHVGSYPIALTGGSDNNYTLALNSSTLTITKAPLAITANNQTKVYGAAMPTLTVTYIGFLNGDTQSVFTTPLSVTTAANISSPAGTYDINPSAAVAGDYDITFTKGTLTINKAVLNATADDKSRSYGAADPAFTITYTGFVNGDNLSSIIQGSATAPTVTPTSNVGTYEIVPAGGSADNYSFNYVNGTLTIGKAVVTITAQDATRTYGSPEPTFTALYSGFLNGQNSSVLITQPTGSTNATITSDVGEYTISFAGAAAQNYSFSYASGKLTITKATVTATADDKTRSYGVANPTLTITYTGFKNSQDISVIDVKPTVTTSATIASNAGAYPITVSGGSDGNYTFSYQPGTLTINKAVLLATADSKSKVYGTANPVFTVTYSGLLGGDVPDNIATPPAMTTTADTNSVVGNYIISISGGSDENYTFNYANGTLSITRATVTVRPADQTRVYGAVNPTFTINYTGLVSGDQPDVAATVSNPPGVTANAGTYNLDASGATDPNYTFIYQPGVLTIAKATLTLTANNQSRTYGAANPPLTISYSGFVNGDTPTGLDGPAPSASTTAVVTSPIGNYPITISNGTDKNYTYNLIAGNLNITRATLTVTADNKTRPYNTANPPFTLSYSGFMNSDGVGSITPPTASTAATPASAVGDYTISVSGGNTGNYTINPVSGTLTITKATPVVTWINPTAITYGTALSATQLNASANVSGEFTYTPASGTVLNAGANQQLKVDFTPSDATNYNIVNGTTVTITVNKATPVITWANPAAITYGTLLNSTNHLNATANVPGTFTYTPAIGTLLTAGANQTLKADFHPTDASNYNEVTNIQRQITVNKATPTVTWANPAPITYGTPLGATQLNATFTAPGTSTPLAGTATYLPDAGTILSVGTNKVLSVSFIPSDGANYNSVSNVQVLINVIKATPVITWANPADITYGTALSSTQLNATSSVPGTFSYTPAAGTVLQAGSGQTLTVAFTPTDVNNFNSVASTTVSIDVNKADPVIAWSNPSAITYGTALSITQLNPTSSVPGSFTFNPVAGTVLNAGNNQTISSTFTPTDQTNYNTIVTNRTITVNKATPGVTWTSPAQIVYGTPLTSTQQNASATVPGTFDYTPPAGTILNTGVSQVISVKFTPNDITNYNIVPVTNTSITVVKATPVVIWTTPLPIKVGVPLSATQLNATANVPGTKVYSPDIGHVFNVEGTYPLHVAFTPTDQANYNNVPDTQVDIVISSKDNPVITWSDPAAIMYGTALSATQLNATGSVPGTLSYSPVAGTKLNAGTSQTLTVTFTPTDLVNYNIVNKSVHIDVNKAPLTATAANASRAYGNSNPSFVINYTGFVNGDVATVLDTPPTATCAAVVTDAAGSSFPIIPANGSDNNYSFTYVNGTLTINKAPLVATADNKTRTYGISNPPFTISYSGFVNGDDEGDITAPSISTSALITSNVGNYAITLTGGSAVNYTITNQPGTLSISKALLVVIGNDLTKTYGQPNPPLTFRYIGFKNGDSETSIGTPPTTSTTATAASIVGTYPVTVSGGSATNYSLQTFDGSLTVSKASLTVKADNLSKIYGQANPPLTFTYNGFLNGDTPANVTAPTIATSATASSPVASYPISLTGGAAANYDLVLQNGTLTVTPAVLTAKANNKTRVYGASNPVFDITYTGFVNGDDVGDITPPSASSTATVTSSVGTYPITVTGGDADNYTFAFQPGTLTITPASLIAKANDRTRTYGQGPGTLTITYTGFLNGDNSSNITQPTASTAATSTSNVGTYPITLTGGSALNYTLTLQPGTLTISKRVLIIKVDDKSRPYGSPNPPNSLTYEGFVNGDDASSITPPGITGPSATIGSPAGSYPITIAGGFATNYTFDLRNGSLTITKVMLTAKADNKARVYGSPDPPFTITYTGFVNGENASMITSPLSATTTATATSEVGTYPIKITPGTNNYYEYTYVDGTLTINKKSITVTAENKTREYGSPNPTFTLVYSGLANDETADVIDVPPTISTIADEFTPVDPSPETPIEITLTGGSDNNYDLTTANGTLSITKALLTAKADDKTRAYGSPNPVTTITYTGFKNGENESNIVAPTTSTAATIASPVGDYPIVVSGGSADNYDLVTGNGTLTVDRAILAVKANDQSRSYGTNNPGLTLTYEGFVNDENISVIDLQPAAATTATVTSDVGTYPITVSGGADDNYGFAFTTGTLAVTKATLTATADAKATTYGTIPELSVSYSGFVNGEDISVIDTKPVASTVATVTSGTGSYPITLSTGSDNNYNIANVTGTLTINKAPLTVTADDKSRIIGLPNPAFTVSYSGFMNGETESALDSKPTAATAANLSSPPGIYAINVTGGNDDHYEFIYNAGVLTVILDNPPVAKNFQVETDEDTQFNFGFALFDTNHEDDPNGKIIYVKVKSLPQNGVLFRGSTRVVAGDEITVANGKLSEDLSYQPNSNYSGNDAFKWNMFDGTFPANNDGTITIKILPVNDPPVLSNIESGTLAYSLGDKPVHVSQQLIINDVDDNFIFSASVLIASNYTEGDELSVEGGAGSTDIDVSYDPASGELTLTGKDTRANYQSMLTKVSFFSPVSGEATISEKNITFVVRDSTADSNPATRKVEITEVFPELDFVNSFTPNGDEVNDYWDIRNLDGYTEINVFVFNQDGARVFECHEATCAWDGTNKGVALPAGPYMYTIDVNNGKRQYKGTVNILK